MATGERTMDRKKSSGHRDSTAGELPLEIVERVLSFLPVPVLCRFRSVCKGWKELLSKPSFHANWELNGRTKPYLFAVRSVVNLATEYEYLDPVFLHAICFFDVHEQRWYSINAREGFHPRNELALTTYFAEDFNLPSDLAPSPHFGAFVGMHDGLLCEAMRSRDKTQILSLVLIDPVAETKKEILVPPMPCRRGGTDSGDPHYFPMVVTAWRRVAGGLEIFLLNNECATDATQMHHQEPSTGAWRELEIPLQELGLRKAVSAVIFQGILYIVFYPRTSPPESPKSKVCILMSYNLEKRIWKEVPLRFPTGVGGSVRIFFPRDFVVSGGRLFLMTWGLGNSGPINYQAFFAVVEIQITSSKIVVQIPTSCTRYHNPSSLFDYLIRLFTHGYGVPCVDSGGICRSVLWVTKESGEVAVCDIGSGAMTYLTPHPLREVEGREMAEGDHPLGQYLRNRYRWRYMSLNWTKLLTGVVANAQDATT